MRLLACDRRVPWLARGVAAGSALYVVFPFNIIPDYVPVIGLFDDVGVLGLGLWLARCLVPSHIIAEHRAAIEHLFAADAGLAPDGPPGLGRTRRSGWAFGVDPVRREFYSLRQARYDALAQDVSDWVGAAAASANQRVLIVGCGVGTELRHLEAKPHFEKVILSGANLGNTSIYRREAYDELFIGDLTRGYPEIRDDLYDVVVCEQVLEHLDQIGDAIAALDRVLKPGGKAIVGVPIFVPPLHLLRKYVVPKLDAISGRRRARGHRQAFSLRSFLREVDAHSELDLAQVRGFRIISGGLLRPLDNCRWWWRFNRRLGELMPSLCIEVQAVFEKPSRWPAFAP